MAQKRKAPILTARQQHRQAPLELRVKQDDYDRAQVLAQLAADLARHSRIRDAVLFKGGAILQMGHNSPRYSRDLDATAIAKQPIRKTWVEEVLETRRLGKSGGYVKTHELVVQGKRLSTKKLKCLAASGREVDLHIEINWSEEPIRPAGEKLLVKAVNREPVELPVMDRAERAAEKLRAFLERGRAGDAYDLYFLRERVLTARQFQEITPMLPRKFAVSSLLKSAPNLSDLFDQSTAAAKRSYESGAIVIAGTAPAWETIAAALPPWRKLVE